MQHVPCRWKIFFLEQVPPHNKTPKLTPISELCETAASKNDEIIDSCRDLLLWRDTRNCHQCEPRLQPVCCSRFDDLFSAPPKLVKMSYLWRIRSYLLCCVRSPSLGSLSCFSEESSTPPSCHPRCFQQQSATRKWNCLLDLQQEACQHWDGIKFCRNHEA